MEVAKVAIAVFWDAGRQVVVKTGENTCFCQSIEGEGGYITRLQVPPRAPKKDIRKDVLFLIEFRVQME